MRWSVPPQHFRGLAIDLVEVEHEEIHRTDAQQHTHGPAKVKIIKYSVSPILAMTPPAVLSAAILLISHGAAADLIDLPGITVMRPYPASQSD